MDLLQYRLCLIWLFFNQFKYFQEWLTIIFRAFKINRDWEFAANCQDGLGEGINRLRSRISQAHLRPQDGLRLVKLALLGAPLLFCCTFSIRISPFTASLHIIERQQILVIPELHLPRLLLSHRSPCFLLGTLLSIKLLHLNVLISLSWRTRCLSSSLLHCRFVRSILLNLII